MCQHAYLIHVLVLAVGGYRLDLAFQPVDGLTGSVLLEQLLISILHILKAINITAMSALRVLRPSIQLSYRSVQPIARRHASSELMCN